MKSLRFLAGCTAAVLLSSLLAQAQGPVTGLFFNEGWESGTLTGSFNSQMGGVAQSSQFSADQQVRASGNYSLRHRLQAGMAPDDIDVSTQHFGDARTGPVWPNGQGQHFYDLYVQYKIQYSQGFDFGQGHYKQFMIGTQDDRRHDEACCLPFAAHYVTIQVFSGGRLTAEAYNKQSASSTRFGLPPNAGGYSGSNQFTVQSGRWYTMEIRRRLNDAGQDNGIFQMWVDGVLIANYSNLRLRVPPNGAFGSNYTYGTNFVHLNDYTTFNVARNQDVYYDDVKFSTAYIGTGGAVPSAPTNLRIVP